MELRGCGTALVTPFRGDGSLDEASLRALVEWQIESGIRFLVACGTTAETPTLSDEEWLRVVRIIAATTAGRVPVLAGCTHNATREAVERARRAAAIPGVDGLLAANPYYNKPTQEGQYRHFRAIAEAVACPIVLYNIPGRTGVNLEPATVLRLAKDAPNIGGIKESSGNVQQIAELIHLAPEGFSVFSGDDGMALPVIALGGAGLVSVASNEIPAEMSRMMDAALDGDWKLARKLHSQYLGLMTANFAESSPGPVKCVMAMMGRLEENYRLPMVPVSAGTREKLARLVAELGLVNPCAAGEGMNRAGKDRGKMTMIEQAPLAAKIEQYFQAGADAVGDPGAMEAFLELRSALSEGRVRAAAPDSESPSGWSVNPWVKQGILLGFRLGALEQMGGDGFSFVDKATYPARRFAPAQGVRIVPGGSSVREGAYLARGVVCMPPMYVNVGAYVDEETMVDSHALVGSCAQIGKRVHLSAGAQIGGVLEPVNATPVIIEDDVLVGGNTGIYEGTLVRRRAVLAAGTILTRGTPVYDIVHGEVLKAAGGQPLVIPEGAVVVPGARSLKPGAGGRNHVAEWGLSLFAPVIVKYRDEKTELSSTLEELLR